MASVVETNTHFLKRDSLYADVKPYSLRFTPPGDFPRANILLERHNIEVHDVRNEKSLNFTKDGATILPFHTRMSYDDYDEETIVKDVLLKEVSNLLKDFLGAQHVQIFEHTVRSAQSDGSAGFAELA